MYYYTPPTKQASVDTMCQEWTQCMFSPCEEQTSNKERTHWMSAVCFDFRFGLLPLQYPRINLGIMGLACVRSSLLKLWFIHKRYIDECVFHSAYTTCRIRAKCGLFLYVPHDPKEDTKCCVASNSTDRMIRYQFIFNSLITSNW